MRLLLQNVSILAQPSVAVVDEVVDYRDTRDVATEYLNYLYSVRSTGDRSRELFPAPLMRKS